MVRIEWTDRSLESLLLCEYMRNIPYPEILSEMIKIMDKKD